MLGKLDSIKLHSYSSSKPKSNKGGSYYERNQDAGTHKKVWKWYKKSQ